MPLGQPSPSTPLRPRTPPPHKPRPPPPGALQKEPGEREGEGREGRAATRGKRRQLQCGDPMVGTLQTAVGAGPTSGGFRSMSVLFPRLFHRESDVWMTPGAGNTILRWQGQNASRLRWAKTLEKGKGYQNMAPSLLEPRVFF